jgi:hypothetical protein
MLRNKKSMFVLFENASTIYFKENNKIFKANYSNQHENGLHKVNLINVKEIKYVISQTNFKLKNILLEHGLCQVTTKKLLLERIGEENNKIGISQKKIEHMLKVLYKSTYGNKLERSDE